MGAYAIVAALLTFFAPEIVRTLATEEYYEAIYIMPPIAGGVFLTCVSNMYSNIMIYYKKTEFPFTLGQNQYDFIDYPDFCAQVAAVVGQKNEQAQ